MIINLVISALLAALWYRTSRALRATQQEVRIQRIVMGEPSPKQERRHRHLRALAVI